MYLEWLKRNNEIPEWLKAPEGRISNLPFCTPPMVSSEEGLRQYAELSNKMGTTFPSIHSAAPSRS